ncbi:MAG: hypothetical protein VB061_08240 [Christensenella sp.]|nr:hypothetical protein [Christensenella sp.]
MKKVLLLNQNSINSNNATGITLRSIFGRYDRDCLLDVSFGNCATVEGLEVRRLKLKWRRGSLGSILMNKNRSKLNQKIKLKEQTESGSRSKLKQAAIDLRQYIVLMAQNSGVTISRANMDAINEFKPDIIYTLGSSVQTLKTAYRLSVRLSIPIVLHFMDNWRHSLQWDDNKLLSGYKKKLEKCTKLCYSRASKCVAISRSMANAYEDETGIPHEAIMNSIDAETYYCGEEQRGEPVFTVVYAGGLHLGRDKALKQIGEAIDVVVAETGRKVKFDIYTSTDNTQRYQSGFSGCTHTRFLPVVSHDQITNVYRTANLLVHVESAALIGSGFFQYSISTKIPEYLSTGRLMLFYGPEDISLYKLLEENGISAVTHDVDDLLSVLRSITTGDYQNGQITERAKKFAKENFSAASAFEKLCSVIDDAKLPDGRAASK